MSRSSSASGSGPEMSRSSSASAGGPGAQAPGSGSGPEMSRSSSADAPPPPLPTGRVHLANLTEPLAALQRETDRLDRWGAHAASVLLAGGRLLAAGNGGSAAEAQHLTAELVGRYRDDRVPLSAIALHAETSSLTAIGNDYDYAEVFARQVRAHGRPGDVCVLLSTSGTSPNVLRAAEVAAEVGITTWALTGRAPNPLALACDDALCVEAGTTATVQEIHLIAVHLLCAAIDVAVREHAVAGVAR
jgi:D-sedoheptulose 7-phosphate isomerase